MPPLQAAFSVGAELARHADSASGCGFSERRRPRSASTESHAAGTKMPPLQAAFLWVPSLLGTPIARPVAASPNGADQGRHLPKAIGRNENAALAGGIFVGAELARHADSVPVRGFSERRRPRSASTGRPAQSEGNAATHLLVDADLGRHRSNRSRAWLDSTEAGYTAEAATFSRMRLPLLSNAASSWAFCCCASFAPGHCASM